MAGPETTCLRAAGNRKEKWKIPLFGRTGTRFIITPGLSLAWGVSNFPGRRVPEFGWASVCKVLHFAFQRFRDDLLGICALPCDDDHALPTRSHIVTCCVFLQNYRPFRKEPQRPTPIGVEAKNWQGAYSVGNARQSCPKLTYSCGLGRSQGRMAAPEEDGLVGESSGDRGTHARWVPRFGRH